MWNFAVSGIGTVAAEAARTSTRRAKRRRHIDSAEEIH
jgi:hypothetical protein